MEEEKGTTLFQIERHNKILAELHKEGKILVNDLSQKLGVSSVTIRSDLNSLEQEGLLVRTHGGAVEKNRTKEDLPLDDRMLKRFHQKEAIAAKALELISDGDTLAVDGGTTLFQFISKLSNSDKQNVTVITNFVSHMDILKNSSNITTFLLGGEYNKQLRATTGLSVIKMLKLFRTDKVLMSATGVSVEDGVTFATEQDAEVKRTMLEQGKTRILLTDSSKIGKSFFVSAGELNKMDILVTDWEVSEETVKEITNLGVKVIVAPKLN